MKQTTTEESKLEQEILAKIGRRGGLVTKKRHGRKHYATIGKMSAKRRWGKDKRKGKKS